MKKKLLKTSLFFAAVLLAGNVYADYQCNGNNILSGATIQVGENFFAEGCWDCWDATDDYTATWASNAFTIHLGHATGQAWMAQFKLNVPNTALVADRTYFLSFDIQTNVALPLVYMKVIKSGDDGHFLDIPSLAVPAGTKTVSGILTNSGVTAITEMNQIIFDFGGNPANADIIISNIMICDDYTSGITEKSIQSISFVQDANVIRLYSENGVSSAKLYTISGQDVASGVSEINITSLATGVYVLKAQDLGGNVATFKIVVSK